MGFYEGLNLHSVFTTFGSEVVTKSSHLEKLCLIQENIGRDNVSDFATNLIKDFLASYTQEFALKYLPPGLRRRVPVRKAAFNYNTETWETRHYQLPWLWKDYVLLTPKDLLTKDEAWLNRKDMLSGFDQIVASVSNDQLRSELNNYFRNALPKDPSPKDEREAAAVTINRFPAVIDYYIRQKELNGADATKVSRTRVAAVDSQFVQAVRRFVAELDAETDFFRTSPDSYDQAMQRVQFLKDVIENKDGYRVFYVGGKPIQREADLQILYRLTWYAADHDVNREVNNGRGPADFKVSRGRLDATIVEFKLASNSKLRQNLIHQVEIYKKASDANRAIKAILFFNGVEQAKTERIIAELGLGKDPSIVLIDARPRASASCVRSESEA